jgi:hypothetical protein
VNRPKTIAVQITYATPHDQASIAINLPAGATLADALVQSGMAQRYPGIASRKTGVWGRVRDGSFVLRDGDRVEIYRPLAADPKDARRKRVKSGKPV